MITRPLLLLVTFLLFTGSSMAGICDSLGVISGRGGSYYQHKVEKGETFYSLSKQYGLTVADVKKANSNSDVLSVGTLLTLPVKEKAEFQNIHVVGPKETLYSIATKYGITVDELKKLNELTENNLSIGQKLFVSKTNTPQINQRYHTVIKGETLYSLSKKYELSISQIKDANNIGPNESIKVGQRLAMPELITIKKNTSIGKTSGLIKCENSEHFGERFSECLHNNQAIGSILKVYVKETKSYIYLRVVGKLPENTETELIINKKACAHLNPDEKSFHGEISNIE